MQNNNSINVFDEKTIKFFNRRARIVSAMRVAIGILVMAIIMTSAIVVSVNSGRKEPTRISIGEEVEI